MGKQNYKNKSYKTKQRHHFNPTSRGGTDDEKNIKELLSEEDRILHGSWHNIFENFKPTEIILTIFSIKFCLGLVEISEETAFQKQIKILKEFLNRKSIRRLIKNKSTEDIIKGIFTKDKKSRQVNWQTFFEGKSLDEIIEIIENGWSPDSPNNAQNK